MDAGLKQHIQGLKTYVDKLQKTGACEALKAVLEAQVKGICMHLDKLEGPSVVEAFVTEFQPIYDQMTPAQQTALDKKCAERAAAVPTRMQVANNRTQDFELFWKF